MHVEDAARGFGDAVPNPDRWTDLVYNVGSNRENYQISEIAEHVRAALDRDLDIVYLGDEHPGPSYHVNFERIEGTGFELEWPFGDGVVHLASRLGEADSDAKHIPGTPLEG